MPKHVGVLKDCTITRVACAVSWFNKRKQVDLKARTEEFENSFLYFFDFCLSCSV